MADNDATFQTGAIASPPSGFNPAVRNMSLSGDTAAVQVIVPIATTGSEGSWTAREFLIADDAAFTPGTNAVAMFGAEYDDTTPDSVDEGDAGALRMSARRELYVQLRDAAGNERGLNIDGSGNITVNVTGTVTVAGDVANDGIDSGNPVKVGGKASTSAATSVAAGDRVDLNLTTQGAVILGSVASMTDAASAAPAGVTLSNSSTVRPLGAAMYIFNGTGHDRAPGNATDGLLVNLGANNDVSLNAGTNAIGKLAANSGVDIGDVDVTSVVPGTGATNLGKAEDGAHSTGDTGVMLLGVRTDTPNAARADTDLDYTPIATYRTGAVRTAIPEEDFAALGSNHVKKYYTNAGAVTDGIIWSPAAGKRWYVTDLIINTSAAATVTLEDDLAAGDAVVAKFELAANSGVAHHFATPLFSGEDAADLLVTTSAGNIYITCVGYEI